MYTQAAQVSLNTASLATESVRLKAQLLQMASANYKTSKEQISNERHWK